jgi:hypothetical protein
MGGLHFFGFRFQIERYIEREAKKKRKKKDGDWTSFGIDLFLYVDRYISSICSLLGHARNVFLCFHVFIFDGWPASMEKLSMQSININMFCTIFCLESFNRRNIGEIEIN